MVSAALRAAAVLALASCHTSSALQATILADTNRDGTVDASGNSDVEGKEIWTTERGALFLPNVVWTPGSCTTPTTLAQMHTCHDAVDNVLRQSQYLAPLLTLPVVDLSESAVGTVNVTNAAAVELVRLFYKEDDGEWNYVDEDRQFTAAQLSAGLHLGIDARDLRRPGIWDGLATVQFSVTDGGDTSTDTVELRLAPYLTNHPGQEAQQVLGSASTRAALVSFNEELAMHSAASGINSEIILLAGQDIWVQDYFEPGYSSIPGPDGPVTVHILLMSHARRSATRGVYRDARGPSVGAMNFPEVWSTNNSYWGGTHDSTGNLETIPPHSHNGKDYPAGRIIMGVGADDEQPLILPFLRHQELQDPILLDVSWLRVGHVDEFIQFLPADNERGWIVMADDPLAGITILQNASAAGHGDVRAISRPSFEEDKAYQDSCVPKSTIDYELTQRPNLLQTNQYAAERIEANLEILKRETGITDEDIFRVPGIFHTGSRWSCANDGVDAAVSTKSSDPTSFEDIDILDAANAGLNPASKAQRRQSGAQLHAHYPSAVNGVVLPNRYYLAPNPWGPVIDGVDIFAEAVTAAYAAVGFDVHFIDTFFTHHRNSGEVHCGSNVWREMDSVWW